MNKYDKAIRGIAYFGYCRRCREIFGTEKCVRHDCYNDVKALDELVEKATPKKPIQLENKDRSRCPNCKNQLPFRKNALKKQNPRIYCDRCGQAIDWSDEE